MSKKLRRGQLDPPHPPAGIGLIIQHLTVLETNAVNNHIYSIFLYIFFTTFGIKNLEFRPQTNKKKQNPDKKLFIPHDNTQQWYK